MQQSLTMEELKDNINEADIIKINQNVGTKNKTA